METSSSRRGCWPLRPCSRPGEEPWAQRGMWISKPDNGQTGPALLSPDCTQLGTPGARLVLAGWGEGPLTGTGIHPIYDNDVKCDDLSVFSPEVAMTSPSSRRLVWHQTQGKPLAPQSTPTTTTPHSCILRWEGRPPSSLQVWVA